MQDVSSTMVNLVPKVQRKLLHFFGGGKEVAGRLVVKSSAVASKKRRRRREAMSRGIRFSPPSKRTHSSKMETAIFFFTVIRIYRYLRYGRAFLATADRRRAESPLQKARWLIFPPHQNRIIIQHNHTFFAASTCNDWDERLFLPKRSRTEYQFCLNPFPICVTDWLRYGIKNIQLPPHPCSISIFPEKRRHRT